MGRPETNNSWAAEQNYISRPVQRISQRGKNGPELFCPYVPTRQRHRSSHSGTNAVPVTEIRRDLCSADTAATAKGDRASHHLEGGLQSRECKAVSVCVFSEGGDRTPSPRDDEDGVSSTQL